MSDFNLQVENREQHGKNANRRLRADGMVPAVVYGGDIDPATIKVSHRAVEDLIKKTADANPVFLLQLAGTDKKRHAMIREIHADVITGKFLHVDFIRINMKEEIQTSVTIELHGTPEGQKLGGILDWVTREVEIMALPDAIPGHVEVDISGLLIGQHLETSDLELPDGVRLAEEGSRVIVSLKTPAAEAEVEESDDEAEPIVIGQAVVEE